MSLFNFFSKNAAELDLLQELLGVISSHTKKHNTVTAIQQGIALAEGLSGSVPGTTHGTPPATVSGS